MKNAACLWLAAVVFCAIFTGCGSAAPAGVSPGAPSSAPASAGSEESKEPVTLTVYLERDYLQNNIYGEPVDPPLVQALDRFKAQNPNIEIVYDAPWPGFSHPAEREAEITRLSTEIMAGKGPDLFLMDNFRVSDSNLFPNMEKAIRNGAFYDLTEELARNGVKNEDFVAGLFEAGQHEGAQYVVPFSFSTLCALADESRLLASGFNENAAQESTAAFFAELQRLDAQSPINLYFDADLVTNMDLPVLDYDHGQVNLALPEIIAMLELEQSVFQGRWNMQKIPDTYSIEFGRGMQAGDPFMMITTWPVMENAAWQVAAAGAVPWVTAVPNETGHVTATLESYGMVNANTPHPAEAAALLAYLLSEECQSAAEYPNDMTSFPVRRGCTQRALVATQEYFRNLVSKHQSTPEEAAECQAQYGAPLPPQTVAQLEASFEQISAVRFHSVWDRSSVQLGTDANGIPLVAATKEKLTRGEISMGEFLNILEPRLQLYMDE